MKLSSIKDLDLIKKTVLLRVDYDVPLDQDGRVSDASRIEDSLPTLKYLIAQKAKIIVLAHLNRPGGKIVKGLSLKPVAEKLNLLLDREVRLSTEILGKKTDRAVDELKPKEILLLENLRFDPREVENDKSFAKKLASLGEVYVNDAFAVSHRTHASIVGIPRYLPSVAGLDLLKEIDALSNVLKKPRRPVVVILGGVKRSKTETVKKMVGWADHILVGGKLVIYNGISKLLGKEKIRGNLKRSGEDISMKSIEEFEKVITKAETIIWSGPMGAYEKEEFSQGTRRIAQAVADSGAYTVVGGGDTEAALTKFGLVDKIDYISSGGGAMLFFLAKGTLPGIEAIKKGGRYA
jgi:phosphoglycerate kinase